VNEKTWARDAMLRLIRLRRLPIGIQPGLNPDYPAGLTPDGFSDYTAFNDAGIPIVAFESTNYLPRPAHGAAARTPGSSSSSSST
jgi:alkaline phosphatase isozyme conversion protein